MECVTCVCVWLGAGCVGGEWIGFGLYQSWRNRVKVGYVSVFWVRWPLNPLSVQYLLQCLDTENVCHHITKMDLPPKEMKETIFTRHYQTVLPLLAGQFHIREIKIENYEIELIYTRVWFSGAHQFTSSRTVSYFKM